MRLRRTNKKSKMLHTFDPAPDYLSLMGHALQFDLSWPLPPAVSPAQAFEFLAHFRNRFPLYDADSQTLHLNYQLQIERASAAIGITVDPQDTIAVPSAAISMSSSYILPASFFGQQGYLAAHWQDASKTAMVCSLSTAIERMTAHSADYFLPVLTEKSLSVLPESGCLILRLCRLDGQKLFGFNQANVRQLQMRMVAAMQWLQ